MTKLLKTCSKVTSREKSKPMIQAFDCKFCGKKFHKEGTLVTHMCVKKRRHMEADTIESRFGFRTFQRFYDITMSAKKPKTMAEFIDSPYYIDFVKFGNHLAILKPVYPEQFIDFVITNGIKLKDWSKDFVYDTYVEALVKKEPAVAATDRTISSIMEWSASNGTEFTGFFNDVSANEAANMIRTGKISPWVLYLCATGGTLMDRFNDDHAKVISGIIDPKFWMKKFKKDDDVEYIRTLLEQVGL